MITLEQTIKVVDYCKQDYVIEICCNCPYKFYGNDCDKKLREDVVKYLQLLVM